MGDALPPNRFHHQEASSRQVRIEGARVCIPFHLGDVPSADGVDVGWDASVRVARHVEPKGREHRAPSTCTANLSVCIQRNRGREHCMRERESQRQRVVEKERERMARTSDEKERERAMRKREREWCRKREKEG